MDHRLAHRGKDGLGPRKSAVAAADHEGQSATIGCSNAARYRRIDHFIAGCGRIRSHRAGGIDIDRRTIEQDRTFGRMADDFACIDVGDDLAVGQHRYNRFDIGHRIAHVGEGRATIVLRARQCLGRQIKCVDAMSGLHKVRGHPAAHITETDKGYFHWRSKSLPTIIRITWLVPSRIEWTRRSRQKRSIG